MSQKAAKRLRQAQRAATVACKLDRKRRRTEIRRNVLIDLESERLYKEIRKMLRASRRRAALGAIVRVLTFGLVKL